MAKKKKRASKLLENRNSSIAGIPIEKCDLSRVKQSHAGVVYLTDNRSKYMTTKRQKQQEQIRIPTKTIKIDGTPTIYVYRGYLMIEDDLLIDYYMIVNDIQLNIPALRNRDSGVVETNIPDTETAFDWLDCHS